jgi:hypothetical protein
VNVTSLHHAPFLAAVALLAVPGTARPSAEEPSSTPGAAVVAPAATPRPEGRELAGHLFMPALGIVGPFATTSFGTWLTLGTGTTTGSVTLQIPGNPAPPPQTITGKVSYAAVGGALAYEYQFLPGVSGRFQLTETLYSGTTGAAVAVVGTNARIGAGLGLTAGLPIGDSVRVAAVLDTSYVPRIGLLLGPAIKSAYQSCSTGVADCRFDFAQLFQQKNVLQLQPGVAAAWTPVRALGVTGNLSYSYSSLDSTGSGTVSQSAVSVGAAFDFDFRMISSVPVGIQVTWNSNVPVSGGGESRFTDVGGGLFYTGRKDLSLGLQVVDRRFKVVPEVDVSWSTVLAIIGLRYYW